MWKPIAASLVIVSSARARSARPALPAPAELSALYYAAAALVGALSIAALGVLASMALTYRGVIPTRSRPMQRSCLDNPYPF